MSDTTGRYDDWCHTELLAYSGGGHKDGLFAEATLIEYRWHGKQEDPRPDDAEEIMVEMVRKDIHEQALRAEKEKVEEARNWANHWKAAYGKIEQIATDWQITAEQAEAKVAEQAAEILDREAQHQSTSEIAGAALNKVARLMENVMPKAREYFLKRMGHSFNTGDMVALTRILEQAIADSEEK